MQPQNNSRKKVPCNKIMLLFYKKKNKPKMLPCTNKRLRLGQYPGGRGEEGGLNKVKSQRRRRSPKSVRTMLYQRDGNICEETPSGSALLFFLVCGRLSRLRPPWVDSCQPRQRAGLLPYLGTSGQTPALTHKTWDRGKHTRSSAALFVFA